MSTENREKFYLKNALAVAVGFTLAGLGSTSLAQQGSLEEVIVTAQKRAESVQDVPVAITAFTGQNMENMLMETANDIAAGVPNLMVSSPFGESQPVFSIRGQTMADYNPNQSSPVGIYVDEAYLGASFMQGFTLFDLHRVEVLRGPQGTLYGKNTTGGAINFISNAPSFDGTNGYLTLTGGDYNRRASKGAFETVLVEDKLAMRAAYTITKTDGHHENLASGKDDMSEIDTWSGRVSFKYQAERWDATLRYTHGESDATTKASLGVARLPDGQGGFTDVYGLFNPGSVPREPGWDAWEGAHDHDEDHEKEADMASLTFNMDFENFRLTSLTSYIEGDSLNSPDSDGANYNLMQNDWGSDIEQFAQDLRISTSFDGPYNVIAGVYYATDDIEVNNHLTFYMFTEDLGIPFDYGVNSGLGLMQDYTQSRDSYAIYAHNTFRFTDDLTLTLGLRYTRDEGEIDEFTVEISDYDRMPTGVFTIPEGSADAAGLDFDDGEWTGKLGLDYALTDELMIYASYSRGYRSSAFNGGAAFGPDELGVVDPEFVDAYEVGFKSRFWDARMQLNGAAFYYDYSDQQFINVIGIQQNLVNGDESEIAGFELELTALVTDNLTVTSGLGYLDTEYKELTLSNTQFGGEIDLSGNELFNAPKINFNLAIDWVIAENSTGTYRLSADTVYTDDQWFSAYNDDLNYDEIRSDANWMSNARAAWTSESERWEVAAWVKNLSDNDEPVYALNIQSGIGQDYYTVSFPRRWGVDLTYSF